MKMYMELVQGYQGLMLIDEDPLKWIESAGLELKHVNDLFFDIGFVNTEFNDEHYTVKFVDIPIMINGRVEIKRRVVLVDKGRFFMPEDQYLLMF